MKTLQHFHFQMSPKPKEEDYTRKVDGIERYYIDPQFEKDTAEWKRLYGDKPEPEWEEWANASETWPVDRAFYVSEDGVNFEISVWGTIESEGYPPDVFKFFADKATYDTRLAEWKYHQVRYPKFKKCKRKICVFQCKDGATVRFDGKATTIWGPGFHCDFEEGLSVSLFELICKENGVEL